MNRWIGSYLKQELKKVFNTKRHHKKVHVMFSCVDHYEPDWHDADEKTQLERVQRWVEKYPALAKKHKDADGCHPRHTFFYPAEVYNSVHLDLLAKICKQGFAEVEVHLHHDNDTEETLRIKLEKAKKDFSQHGLLSRRKLSGQIRFGFIHGNWALNNSRKDGCWCGVNDEARILADCGCYADFTYPSAPSETQPKIINRIYYTRSHPLKAKTHNYGVDVKTGRHTKAHLLMVQGPLTFNWTKRKKGIFPRIENGDITGANPPTKDRVDLWIKQYISVKGKPDWIFVKVYTHGAPEKNAHTLLGNPMDEMFSYLEEKYNDGMNFALHYVSAREMFNIIKAAEAGEQGLPGEYRDYILEKNI
ncbi:MAG: hypothetical protein H6755_00965 [Candidatus Omnitrophica bacterium]|nr:hypothetical protein [Candidatus Omnitrophota bacterium]MCB9746960.1 hypothetical protein [Candidatus Omnitrophota bacterium]